MSARRNRRFFLGAITLLGASLIAIAFVVQWRESQRRAVPAPEPAWRSADRSVAYLEHQLRALAPGDTLAVARVSPRLHGYKLLDSTRDSIRVRMTRSLNSGQVFEAEITVTSRVMEAGQEVELNVRRGNQAPVRLRLELRDGAITAVQQFVAPSNWQPWTGSRDLPLALGDLQVGEMLALCRAFATEEFEALGTLVGMGARPQLVLDMRLSPANRTTTESGQQQDNPAAGERALAYVDSATCDLRSVRVLDARGYVVRVYEDLAWETSDRLSQLRVTSLPSSSHTVFHRVAAQQPVK